MDVLQRVDINVPGNRAAWTDSGVTLKAGEQLRITATGRIRYGSHSDEQAFPEGSYEAQSDGSDVNHAEEPENVLDYSGDSGEYPVTNTVPLSLAVYVGAAPAFEPGGVSTALRPNRSATFGAEDLPAEGGRVWLLFNEPFDEGGTRFWDNNHGAFSVTIERLGTADPLQPGTVSPIRLVPLDVYREKLKSVENTAVCWFIRPKYGPPEGYTEMDFPIDCPEIQLPTGADDEGEPLYTVIPALTYEPFSGLSITGVPTTVKLGVDAPDVTVIAFDQAKLRREYYEESQVEVFEIALDGDRSKPMLYLSGVLGNCEGDALSATIELTPYDELTNLPVGWKMGFLCDVGRLPGEEFGTMRCTNLKKLDGIDIADWTRGARIDSVVSLSRLVLAPESVSGFDGFENDFPGSYGIIQFVGGELDGLRRDVGKFDPVTGIVNLRRALPMQPDENATMTFKAGCDRTFDGGQGCLFWQQGRNFRNTPHLPGRKALRHSISI